MHKYLQIPTLCCFCLHSEKEEDSHEQEVENNFETAQEKRLRLAKQYLAHLESEGIVTVLIAPTAITLS